ncbi:hypothetical protein ACFE04_010503 [Oxalis oulophora]
MSAQEESIEQTAALRRERLKALKAAQQLLENDNPDAKDQQNHTTHQDDGLSMKFRNYVPQDKQLQEGKLAPPVLPKFEDPVAAAPPPPAEKKEDPFLNIAPKKPNWDLRRDVQKKLDKLDRRTHKAIYKLMEEQEKEKQLAEENAANLVEAQT